MPIALERSGERDGYLFRLGLRAGLGGRDVARIPVRRAANPNPHPILKEIYSCEVAGQRLEAANVHALRARVSTLLDSIAPARTLPLCWFGAPGAGYELPVYEDGGELVCPILGGANLKAPDLAGIRAMVARHMLSAGYVDDEDEMAVGVLQPRDLRRVEPAAVFRSDADADVWLPAVDGVSAEGPVVAVLDHAVALAGRRRRGAGPAGRDGTPVAGDALALLRALRGEWAVRRGLDPAAVHATAVRPDVWATAEAATRADGTCLVAHLDDPAADPLELPVRRTVAGDVATALHERGITVLLATDEEALARALGRHLAVAGFAHLPDAVEVRARVAPWPERLDPTVISTSHAGPVGPHQRQEAHA